MASAMDQAMGKSPTESPLSSLVRKVSSKRPRPPPPPTITLQYDDDGQYQPQQPFQGQIPQPLHSPLLHGHFARDSVATASSYERNSMLESASPNSSRVHSFSSNAYPDSELDYNYHYDNAYEESVYSQPDMGSALRDSWRSTASTSTVKASGTALDGTSEAYTAYTSSEPRAQAWADPHQQYAPQPPSPVPSVVVSAPETPTQSQAAGRAPITQRVSPNFSRPGRPPPPSEEQKRENPSTPHDFLMLGIEHHEADRLGESARCFERSAVEQGGCGVGMLMWGLTLRHGWGCAKNEKLAFKWLQKAAESAVGDLEATRAKGIKDNSVVRSELILAIYEVGQCFFQGWGVPKDQKMAVSYYTMAAELGDPDAQMDLAFCLTNGKGCKKDKRQAARWYRAAIKQGQSDVGLAWIYKDKYQ
ncbi:hypothetical protein H1R20_g13290, partial [Candolleomyces eurysporus]